MSSYLIICATNKHCCELTNNGDDEKDVRFKYFKTAYPFQYWPVPPSFQYFGQTLENHHLYSQFAWLHNLWSLVHRHPKILYKLISLIWYYAKDTDVSVMSLLDLNLVFWNQMLMSSMHYNTHTHTRTRARSATRLPQAVTGIIGNKVLANFDFHTQKNYSEYYQQLKHMTSKISPALS